MLCSGDCCDYIKDSLMCDQLLIKVPLLHMKDKGTCMNQVRRGLKISTRAFEQTDFPMFGRTTPSQCLMKQNHGNSAPAQV